MDLSQIGMLRKGDFRGRRSMPSLPESASVSGAGWRRVAALAFAVAAVGLPINHVAAYALLLIATVVIFTGEVSVRPSAWLAAAAIVVAAAAGQWLISPPRIAEGHNVFLPGAADGALQRGLPTDVYRRLQDEFDAQYPPAVRCRPGSPGCWQSSNPDRTFAFSADAILRPSDLSRATTSIDFADAVWLRLGFINELRYNWYTAAPDVHRSDRNRRFWMGLRRWRLTMPWFEVIRLPAAFIGGKLCWRGDIMWETADQHFDALSGNQCRIIAPADAGRRVFGLAIKPGTLAMRLVPPWTVLFQQWAASGLTLVAVLALVAVLVRFRARRTALPLILIGLAVFVIAIDDASFLGGHRPFDGGDDGLFYDGVGRIIIQKFLAGDLYGALEGGEKVFYYGGPGLRYFRAVEHVIFGESYLGYLSLVLLLPFLTYAMVRRFLSERCAIAIALIFTAVPVGHLFGTTFVDYAKWAARGFADPAAYIFFIAALVPLVGSARTGPDQRFAPAFFSAFLFALAIFMKPVVLPAAAVILAGTGLAALAVRQWLRAAGLCVGFVPVLSMTLHNWVYGHAFVPLSGNATVPAHTVMPPSAWLAAAHEVLSWNFSGGYLARGLKQIPNWLYGPAESYATVPINAVGIGLLVYVVVRGRQFDPWLRLIGGAALVQHAVALVYAPSARYYFLAWFLTMLVVAAWLRQVGIGLLERRYPKAWTRMAAARSVRFIASGLSGLEHAAA
jgi:hypothetical protein